MDDDEWESGLWSDTTRGTYLTAVEAAIDTLRSHAALVASASSDTDEPRIDESADELRAAFVAVSEAEFNYSATVAPFSTLRTEEYEWDADEGVPLDTEAEHNQLSVMVRRDYRLTSQAEVLDAGRRAYLEVWPEDSPEAADEDVQHLGRALYQIMHAGGIEALNNVNGLEPTAGIVITVGRTELATAADLEAAMNDPGALFAIDGEVLYSQTDVWRL